MAGYWATWEWLSPVAHGDRLTLERLAADTARSGLTGLRSYLASELLLAADAQSVSAASLQRSVIVPAELWLFAHPRTRFQPVIVDLTATLQEGTETHRRQRQRRQRQAGTPTRCRQPW